MTHRRIVGSLLIKNEDIYIERVIRNIAEFCDQIIVSDDQSEDKTLEIVDRLLQEFRQLEVRRIAGPPESALALEPYFDTPTWIFAVDGDEIFDPTGLKTMRQRLLQGEFDKDWCVFPNALYCTSIDLTKHKARGHLAPPSRASGRLYNFSLIRMWTECFERLHGGKLIFREGFNSAARRYLNSEMTWDASYFRYLHMAFLKRSSIETGRLIKTRPNPAELMALRNEARPIRRLMKLVYRPISSLLGLDWKNRKYRRGPVVEKEIGSFFA